MAEATVELVRVADLQTGDVVRFSSQDPWVTVIRVKKDRLGFDLLYAPNGDEPRWHGFSDGDCIGRRS